MPEPQTIIDVQTATFEEEVLERSKSVPVIVDFWATWCGPCKTLGPLLERLALESPGRFILAKVDVDANASLAQMFKIQSVPAVHVFRNGHLVDGFVGAMDEREVRSFLERALPATADLELDRARAEVDAGDLEAGISRLRQSLRDAPEHVDSRVALASFLIEAGNAGDARAVFARVDPSVDSAEARSVRARLELGEAKGNLSELQRKVEANPADLDARIELGRAMVSAGRHEDGLEALLSVVEKDAAHGDGAARKAIIEVFDLLGPDSDVTARYRSKLSMLLFS
jgi:putative thioredoxin